jgi:hypothetical protein
MSEDPSLYQTLGRVEGKLDQVLAKIDDHVVDDRAKHGELFGRIGKLERGKAYWMGIAAAVGGVGSILIDVLFRK